MIYIFTSAFRETYFDSVRKAFSLPAGSSQRFIYDDKYVQAKIRRNPEAYKGKEAIVLYIKKSDDGQMETAIPLRKVIINDIIITEDIVAVDFIHTHDYWQPHSSKNARNIMRELIKMKQDNRDKFVFEDREIDMVWGTGRKELFHFLLDDPELRKTNNREIKILYSIDILQEGVDTFEDAENGIIKIKRNKNMIIRVYFFAIGKKMMKYFKVYTQFAKIDIPIDYDENDLRSGFIDFLAYPHGNGLEAITIDVDDAYRTTFIIDLY